MSPSKLFAFFIAFVVSVHAIATPHLARSVHHRALAGRVPVPIAANVPAPQIRRRKSSQRCKPRPAPEPLVNDPTPEATNKPEADHVPEAPHPVTTYAHTTHRPTTTKYHPTPPSTPKPAPNLHLPSYLQGTQSGQGTFYATGLGACGIVNKDTDFIAAVSHLLFDTFPNYKGGNPNLNPICGRKVIATYEGRSVTVAITDRCEGCAQTDLDFSPSAFGKLAKFSLGRIPKLTWKWAQEY